MNLVIEMLMKIPLIKNKLKNTNFYNKKKVSMIRAFSFYLLKEEN